MTRNFRLAVSLASLSLCTPVSVNAKKANGELFGMTGGTAAGEAHLRIGERTLRLHFKEGAYKAFGFPSPRPTAKSMRKPGWGYGSYWKVDFNKDNLTKVAFLGKIDPAVECADRLVRQHYRLLSAGKYDRAYRNLGLAWRRQQSLADFASDAKKENLAWARKSNHPFSLVVASASPTEVQELIYIWELKEYYRYTLVKDSKNWKIDHVDQVTKADFDKI